MRDVLKVVRGLRGLDIVGADIVEFSGRKEGEEITAIVASSLGHEMLTIMAERAADRTA